MEAIEKGLKIAPLATKFDPVIYENGTNLLSYRKKDGNLQQRIIKQKCWQDKLRESNLVRSAKSLIFQFDEDSSSLLWDIGEKLRFTIENVNRGSSLTPNFKSVAKSLDKTLNSCLLVFEGLYENFMQDVFCQGRFHQIVYNPREKNLKRFATSSFEESSEADKVHVALRGDFETAFRFFSEHLINQVGVLIQEAKVPKFELEGEIEALAVKNIDFFTQLMRSHVRESYAAGNLYQLQKDNIKWVRWQTGQHVDDCGHCRAIQMGDFLLKVEDMPLDFKRGNLEGISYYLPHIYAITKKRGALFFNHDDCRCNFAPE